MKASITTSSGMEPAASAAHSAHATERLSTRYCVPANIEEILSASGARQKQ